MAHPLDGVRAKLRRANEHRRAFDEVFAQFLNEDPYTVTVEFDPDSGWHSLVWHVWSEPPAERLALIFGDMLSNLRAALDHLVWQLVIANGCTPTDRNAFPVIKKSDDWGGTRGDRLKGVHDTWAAEIEKLQPYNGGNEADLLALLDHVNNINKHRVLPIAVFTPDNLAARINVVPLAIGDNLEFGAVGGAIEDGALALRFRWVERHGELEVDMHDAPTFRVTFRNGVGTNWTNESMFEFVRSVVRLFKPAFAG